MTTPTVTETSIALEPDARRLRRLAAERACAQAAAPARPGHPLARDRAAPFVTTFQAPSTLPIHVNTAHHRLGRVAEKTSNRVKRAEELLRRRANDEPLELMGALILVGRPLEPAVLVEKPQPTG